MRERERYSWQIPGLWSSVLNTLEVARCAEMTLYNNSFGFILWVVYTLCVPRDNHKTANDPGSHSYCSLPCSKTNLPPVVYDDNSASLPTTHTRAHAYSACPDLRLCVPMSLRFKIRDGFFRNNFPRQIIDIITTS